MTSIRQTKKYEKKLVAKEFILLDEPRKWHYSREYKRFHATVKSCCHVTEALPQIKTMVDAIINCQYTEKVVAL